MYGLATRPGALSRMTSMHNLVQSSLEDDRNENLRLLSKIASKRRTLLQPHHVIDELNGVGKEKGSSNIMDGSLAKIFSKCQEAFVLPPWVYLLLRPRPGYWEYLRINVDEMIVEELTVSDYLSHKECLVDKDRCGDQFVLELDLEPFNASFPRMTRPSSIGNGVQFLNRHLSSRPCC